MKIWVCYATAGSGHFRAAEAVYACLKENYPQIQARRVNILDHTNFLFANSYWRGYDFLISHLKFIWALGFRLSAFKPLCRVFNFFWRLNSSKFMQRLTKENPEIIIATHFFPADVAGYLKRNGRIDSRLVTIVTDFGVHTFWTQANSDAYLVGTNYTQQQLINHGINSDKIKVLGIPLRKGFSHAPSKDKGKREFSALLLTGAFGFPFIERIVEALFTEINLLVVCGKNQGLYKRLERKKYSGTRIFSFVEDIPSLMAQADCVITKPGGLSICESLAMERPMVFFGAIPGQEEINARVMQEYGCAITAKDLNSLIGIITDLKAHPEKLESMRASIRKIRKPNATDEICRYVSEATTYGAIAT